MGDLKPLGSEKLKGDEKLRRILELTYYKNDSNNSGAKKSEYITESTTGVYGIVKEKDGYYVKKGLNEGSLDYIGGMFMKNKNRFSSYAEALKRLELLKGQEEILNEETKYVLKLNKPTTNNEAAPPMPAPMPAEPAPAPAEPMPAPDAAPAPDATMAPPADMGELPPADDMGMDSETTPAPESEEDKMKVIQKLTGRLGQKLRDIQDEMESDDIKYIINSVLSAVNLDKLESEDKEEILGKFEDEDEFAGEEGDLETEVPAEEPQPDTELGEVDGIDALESLVNMSFDEDEDVDYKMGSDSPDMLDNPEKEIDIDLSALEPEKTKTRKAKFHVEPDSEEDLYYRQASMDSSFDDEDDLFGDSGYGDMFHFDIKEEDPMVDEGDLSDLYSDEIDDVESDIKDPEFYMDDEDTTTPSDDEVKTKEIDINELTDIINNSVKETLRKHFE
jgi:hypothetical protein